MVDITAAVGNPYQIILIYDVLSGYIVRIALLPVIDQSQGGCPDNNRWQLCPTYYC
ncbi:hypothetical protein A359_02520 [secondary endosymbiont of Ctenarytaina eucalypti]|uniref:Uncharacterized protein n=1 Tax=secondary endosymbiont of Ctenarytaina eucalypti TaxID=1199245 RepID=J3YRH1_9ENTR|nr:hypothetical protein A359_02520 [secondary endosymbiont of Ctenarytaina eucalypti]